MKSFTNTDWAVRIKKKTSNDITDSAIRFKTLPWNERDPANLGLLHLVCRAG